MNVNNFKFIECINNKNILKKFFQNFSNFDNFNSSIIHGDKGIGKATFIKNFINTIFVNLSGNNINEDNNYHYNLILNNSHPNILNISKKIDEKTYKLKNYITIDQIRKIESFIYQSSLNNLPKIILIDSADDLNLNSSNALLKILEEPKKNSIFFLISHKPSSLLPTIRSRCIKFKYNKPNFDEFKKIINLKYSELHDNEELEYLFELSSASPGLAINFYLQETSNTFDNLIQIFKERKILSSKIIQFSNTISAYNNEQFYSFLIVFKFILSNILKINSGVNIKKIISSKLSNKLSEISEYLDNYSCFKALEYLNKYENKLFRLNLDKKIFTMNLISEIIENK